MTTKQIKGILKNVRKLFINPPKDLKIISAGEMIREEIRKRNENSTPYLR